MNKFYLAITGLTLLCLNSLAQNKIDDEPFYHRKGNNTGKNTSQNESSFSGYSGAGANINVTYHRAIWTINPDLATKTITGKVITHFKTIVPNVSTITFDLNQSSFNNGSLLVTYNGITCVKSFPTTNILSITLPSSIPVTGTLDSVVINYSGVPPAVVGPAQGYQKGNVSGIGQAGNYITTLSESYEDRDWWPCKADMQDKIDTMEIMVNVPWGTPTVEDTFWVAANGKLIDSAITGTNRTFFFKSTYPIASYLVAVSVARFNRYYRNVNVNGTNTQVVYNLFRGKSAATYTSILSAMDKVTLVLSAFTNKISEYPFKNDKHGFYDGLLGAGGMEHQGFSGMATGALSNVKTLVHELMHQWFGDNVTFASWNDLWLAEGFARYSEALAGELVPSTAINPYTTRDGIKTAALGLNAQSTWIPNSYASNSSQIWSSNYGSTVYERGAMVVSMLRTLAGDTKFYQALNNYQTALAGKSATTDSLRNHFNRVLGQDISEFFRDYVGGSGTGATAVGGIGNPIISINWSNPVTNNLRLAVASQSRTAGSNVAYFNGPVVVHVTNGPIPGFTKDTSIVFYDWGGGSYSKAGNGLSAPVPMNFLEYTLSFKPTNVFFDDSARTLSTAGTINQVTLVNLNVINFEVEKRSNGNFASLILDDNVNNNEIILERSNNGVAFSEAGNMLPDQSGVQAGLQYVFNDASPLPGNNYYRVKIKSLNNDKYSKIINIVNDAVNNFSIVNNPVKGKLRVRTVGNVSNHNYSFTIYDAQGKKVFQEDKQVTGSILEFETDRLTKGNYLLSIFSQDKKSETLKFVIN
ncbi:MAG: M1 family aminopeptidase [Ferruginibacter sp.]